MVSPDVPPPRQVIPTLSLRNCGTRTLYSPAAFTCRNGFSRTTGVCATLVYGGEGHAPSGGCTTPTNTMFQFAPVQLFQSQLREIHCCWLPESTFPSTSESDIQPPLAQPRFWCSTKSPRTCARRSDTACETAHCIVPPVGFIESPSTALQKVVVALLCSRFASACTLPPMRVASGDAPSPITSV